MLETEPNRFEISKSEDYVVRVTSWEKSVGELECMNLFTDSLFASSPVEKVRVKLQAFTSSPFHIPAYVTVILKK